MTNMILVFDIVKSQWQTHLVLFPAYICLHLIKKLAEIICHTE